MEIEHIDKIRRGTREGEKVPGWRISKHKKQWKLRENGYENFWVGEFEQRKVRYEQ